MSENLPNLKGKRKKKVPPPACANPLFSKWLTQWRDEAVEKGWKSAHTYGKVILWLQSLLNCFQTKNFVRYSKVCITESLDAAALWETTDTQTSQTTEKNTLKACDHQSKINKIYPPTSYPRWYPCCLAQIHMYLLSIIFYDLGWFVGCLKRLKVTNMCIDLVQNSISWLIVRSSKVRCQKNCNKCAFYLHYHFVQYRPYWVLQKPTKMFWVPFSMIFLV